MLFVTNARQGQMMDIEFASRTSVQFDLKSRWPGRGARPLEEESRRLPPEVLPSPNPVRVGEGGTRWELTTTNADRDAVQAALLHALGDGLASKAPSKFAHVEDKAEDAVKDEAAVLPLTKEILGLDAATAEAARAKWPGGYVPEQAMREYKGGAAIFLRDLDPPLSPAEIKDRITPR